MTENTPIVISIGSNALDRSEQMRHAIADLTSKFSDVKTSEIYETLAVSEHDASPYLNAVMGAVTTMSQNEVVKFLKALENKAGRGDADPGVVPLDLDLVIYNGRIVRPHDFEMTYFNIGYRQLLADGAFQYPQ